VYKRPHPHHQQSVWLMTTVAGCGHHDHCCSALLLHQSDIAVIVRKQAHVSPRKVFFFVSLHLLTAIKPIKLLTDGDTSVDGFTLYVEKC
jgi:hypothetical protein